MTDSWRIIQGGAVESLRDIESETVDLIVTSPPYWGLRDYGVEGQLGLESHPQEYLEKLWEIFDECKRVLKPTGCCFVNLGDTYFSGVLGETRNTNRNNQTGGSMAACQANWGGARKVLGDGGWLKPKNLLMIPSRFAIGMQDRGWWLRNDIVWHKPNAMPSSVKDRFSCTWEHVYMFTKSARYWFDLDAVREEHIKTPEEYAQAISSKFQVKSESYRDVTGDVMRGFKNPQNPLGKNPGDCWIIPTQPFPEAHFAVFPEALCLKPIRAGCPAQVCVECGMPWVRIVEEVSAQVLGTPNEEHKRADAPGAKVSPSSVFRTNKIKQHKTIGWQPTCDDTCREEEWSRGSVTPTEPGTVLDPFMGSGTTGLVAIQEGRRFIGIDISEEYCSMARERLGKAQAPLL